MLCCPDELVQLELARRRRHTASAKPLHCWADGLWQELRAPAAVGEFIAQARAGSTQATYAVQRNQFLRFCDMLGVHGEDRWTPDTVCRWIMGRSASSYKLSTIELGLCAIADCLPQHMLAHADIVAALRAAARQPSSVKRRKLPILLSLLRQLVPHEASYWREARDFAFWVLAWFGLFRGAELVSLCWEDVSFHEEGVAILVACSKTDQAGQGQHVFIHHSEDSLLCPVRVLHRLACFGPSGRLRGPVFPVHPGAAGPVSKNTMLARLHRSLADLGQAHGLFGLHSFRSGGATAAAAGGVPERLIKVHGRWVSDVVRIYMCALPADRWEVSAVMQAST